MPKLAEQEPKKIYYFTSNSGRHLKKYSGNLITEEEISQFDVPDFLLEHPPKNKKKNGRQ